MTANLLGLALHVVIDDNIPALSINAHSVFIARPRMELLGVLITALLPVNLDVIVFRNVGLLVLRLMVTVSLSIVIAYSWALGHAQSMGLPSA